MDFSSRDSTRLYILKRMTADLYFCFDVHMFWPLDIFGLSCEKSQVGIAEQCIVHVFAMGHALFDGSDL